MQHFQHFQTMWLKICKTFIFREEVTKITVKFITLGCKTNIYESESMAELFRESGYEIITDDNAPADVCVVNTCTVTGMGARKSRQQIRRAKRQNPNALIAVTGCFSQTSPEEVRELGADIIIGNKGRSKIVELVKAAEQGKKADIVDNILTEHEYEELPVTHTQSRVRANIKIEDGCNNFCTYCIIPYARGPVRSRNIEKIVSEAETLAENGYKEVVLTGIHIGSYGKDLNNGLKLIDVIESVNNVKGIERIRLGSIEPVIITQDFVSRAKNLTKLCPQFHLSLQSGSNATLKRMNRHYTSEEFKKAVELLRENIPDTSITTDLMVGFSGETQDEFLESYEFCKSIGFMQMHIFKYSIREGTAAEKLPDRIRGEIKEDRSRQMIELAENMKEKFYRKYEGKSVSILAEQEKEAGIYHGTTPNHMDVLFNCPSHNIAGETLKAKLTEYKNGFIHGELL